MLWRPVELQKTTFDREFLGVLRNKSVTPGDVQFSNPPVDDLRRVSPLGTTAVATPPGSPLLDPSLARDIVQETLATPREAAPPASRWTDFFHPFRKHRAKSVDTTINSE